MDNHCIGCSGVISKGAHRCRSCAMKARWARDDFGDMRDNTCIDCGAKTSGAEHKRCRPCYVEWQRSPAGREQLSQIAKAGWESGAIGDEEWRRKHSDALLKRWQNPEYQEQRSQELQDAWARGAYDDMVNSEEFKEFHRQLMLNAWDAGKFDHVHQSEQYCQKLSESIKAAWERGMFKGRACSCTSPTKPEQYTMTALALMGIVYEFNSFHLESYTYDFFLPDYNILIEYDGWHWHNLPGAQERDAIKDRLASEAGHRLIRLKGRADRDLAGAEIWGQLSMQLSKGAGDG